jgi:DNA polymerase III delta subunit
VTSELVEHLVPLTRDLDHFQLTKHLVAGRRSTAIEILKRVLDEGAEPLALLGMINYSYRQLLIAKDLMERGADRGQVTGAIRMHPAGHEAFLASARRADITKLATAIKRMAKTDVAIKNSIGGSGPDGARLQIEMLVCELALL